MTQTHDKDTKEAEPQVADQEVYDLETLSKEKKPLPPGASKFRIRVDKTHYVVDSPTMTGAEILTLAGKTPVERYSLREKMAGGAANLIDYGTVVDFRTKGLERFITLALDQTEG